MIDFLQTELEKSSYVQINADPDLMVDGEILIHKKPTGQKILGKAVNTFCASGQIKRKKDNEFVHLINQKGASLQDHQLQIPNYKSWAEILPGKKLSLQGGEWDASYVPQNDFGELYSKQTQTHLQISKDFVEDAVDAFVKSILLNPRVELSYLKNFQYENLPGKKASVLLFVQPLFTLNQVHDGSYSGYNNECFSLEELLNVFKANFDVEERLYHEKGCILSFDDINFSCSLAQEENLEDGFFKSKYGLFKASRVQKIILEGFEKLLEHKEIKFTCAQDLHQIVKKWFVQNYAAGEYKPEHSEMVWDLLNQSDCKKYLFEKSVDSENLEFLSAPFSERGNFWIEAKSLQGLCDKIKDFKLVDQPSLWQADYGVLDEYASNNKKPSLPEGSVVIHGMTGTKPHNCVERFGSIVEHGGLLSYAQRRRRNINLETMSPIGDMASGIDWAVPCKIGADVSYGENVFFVMHPDILKRKHMFFSTKDFGGGSSRWESYKQYANTLGQENIFDPPSHKARQIHFDKQGYTNNETWFRAAVPWNQIVAVVVQGDLFEKINKVFVKGKDDGKIPQSVEIYGTSYANTFTDVLKKISKIHYSEYYKTQSPPAAYQTNINVEIKPSKLWKNNQQTKSPVQHDYDSPTYEYFEEENHYDDFDDYQNKKLNYIQKKQGKTYHQDGYYINEYGDMVHESGPYNSGYNNPYK